MKKLKNGIFDRLFLILYHILALAISLVLVFAYSTGTNLLDFENLYLQLFKQADTALESESPRPKSMVKKIIGTVLVTTKETKSRPAQEGESLVPGSTIETQNKSTALLVFGDKYSSTLRIGSNSILNIDDLMKPDIENKSERSLFNLIKGAVSFLVKSNNQAVDISVKTKVATMGVRGTTFTVLTDGQVQTLLAVKEGIVESENFASMTKRMNPAGGSLVIHKNGKEKDFVNPEIVALFDWDFEKGQQDVPEMNEVLNAMGNPDLESTAPTTNETSQNIDSGMEALKAEIVEFKAYNKDLNDYLLNSNQYLNELKLAHEDEAPKIRNDIRCLSTSKSQCPLYSENLLMKRGFPRTFGTPSLLKMLVNDLNTYLQEQDKKISDAQAEKTEIENLIETRMKLLESAENQQSPDVNTEELIQKLKAPELRMKSK